MPIKFMMGLPCRLCPFKQLHLHHPLCSHSLQPHTHHHFNIFMEVLAMLLSHHYSHQHHLSMVQATLPHNHSPCLSKYKYETKHHLHQTNYTTSVLNRLILCLFCFITRMTMLPDEKYPDASLHPAAITSSFEAPYQGSYSQL